jgi:hypothetical protein
MGGVPLLARRRAVRQQDRVDERHQRPDRRPLALGPFARRGHGARQRLADQPAMDAERPRHPLDGADAELILAANGLEQLHARFDPSHPASLPAAALRAR